MPAMTPERWASLPFDTRRVAMMKAAQDFRVLGLDDSFLTRPMPWQSPWREFVLALRLPDNFSGQSAHPSVSLSTFNEATSEVRVILFRFVCASINGLHFLHKNFSTAYNSDCLIKSWLADCIERYESFLDALELHLTVETPIIEEWL